MANNLPQHRLFDQSTERLDTDTRVRLSYERARLVLTTYNLSLSDVQFSSPRFWDMMMDPIMAQDTAMFTILAAHVGLTIGTLAPHINARPDLKPLVSRLLRMDTVGIYLLTERGHGLDAFNVETTATKTPSGFVLHTPREEASKFMPASTPAFGISKVALVMARLIVDGNDHGPRFFVVPICTAHNMYTGIESTRLPPRPGTCPLDFSITRFNHVQLPPSSLVSSTPSDLSPPERPLEAWWKEVWRIPLGTMAVAAPWITALKMSAYIAGRYSMHRSLVGKGTSPISIISFRTQQIPIAHATASGHVLTAWYPLAVSQFMDHSVDPRVRHALAVIVKTTVCRAFQRSVREVGERCGAQGTFEHNFMARIENDGKGVIIAEGDVLTLCIRLFSEILQGLYTVPLPPPDSSLLAAHAHALLVEYTATMQGLPGGHRGQGFNTLLLPQAEKTIEALGHAMAYAVAKERSVGQPLLDVYESAVLRLDPAWYVEARLPPNLLSSTAPSTGGLSRVAQSTLESTALSKFMPHLPAYLDTLNVTPYVRAPIVSDERWKVYVADLGAYTGDARDNTQDGWQEERLMAML